MPCRASGPSWPSGSSTTGPPTDRSPASTNWTTSVASGLRSSPICPDGSGSDVSGGRARRPVAVFRVRTTERWTWVDLRLVPAAATVWAATLTAQALPTGALLGMALAGAVVAAVLLAGSRGSSGAVCTVLVGCLAALTVVAAVAAVRAHARAGSPLPALAAEGAATTVVIELGDDPRVLAGAGASRVLVPALVTEVAGRRVDGDPVLVFGPAEQWRGLLPGQQVRLRATVRAGAPGEE